ncbi:MAG: hypothetical protein ACOYOK_12735 [Pseudobdellovibrionaceae bacterium]
MNITTKILSLVSTALIATAAQASPEQIPGFTFSPVTVNFSLPFGKAWKPQGNERYPASENCQPEKLNQIFADLQQMKGNNSPTMPALQDKLQNYITSCEGVLNAGGSNNTADFFAAQAVKYDSHLHPWIQQVDIKLSSGAKVRGLLAIKPQKTPRPLVILQCGLFCSANDDAGKAFFMSMVDETPFNILALGSSSSLDYLQANNFKTMVSGVIEGQSLLEISKKLLNAKSSLRSRISSIHLIGQSLGGQAVLSAGLMDSEQKRRTGSSVISSVFAYCPVIDSHPTFYDRELALFSKTPKKATLINSYMDKGIKNFFTAGRSQDRFLPPFDETLTSSNEQYWRLHDFKNYSDKLSLPTMILESQNDPLVIYNDNIGPFLQSGALQRNTNLAVVITKTGNHCNQKESLGWKPVTYLLKQHVLLHSPEFAPQLKDKTLSVLEASANLALKSGERHVQQIWSATAGQNYLVSTFRIADGKNKIREVSVNIPFTKLQALGLPVNHLWSDLDISRVSRWANTNLQWVYGASGAMDSLQTQIEE